MTNKIINDLLNIGDIDDESLKTILESNKYDQELNQLAAKVKYDIYKDEVYIRGLIEFTNFCKNNCFYCGIRRDNKKTIRYRLSEKQILECCDEGYELGFRTFVLQGGEDPFFTDDKICNIVSTIRNKFRDCAITLSIGEKSKESYESYYKAGANRYLLRHETASNDHYKKLHPNEMSLENRKRCLFNLKEIGFQVGSGFMVGSPYQTTENLIEDLRFLQKLQPDMIGIGPYIPHNQTPFANQKPGSVELTLKLISLLRLMFPYALIPATTALGTMHTQGRELGLKAGANVLMPNLSPVNFRKYYDIYDNKICTGDESAQCRKCLENRVLSVGYKIVIDKGDVKKNCHKSL